MTNWFKWKLWLGGVSLDTYMLKLKLWNPLSRTLRLLMLVKFECAIRFSMLPSSQCIPIQFPSPCALPIVKHYLIYNYSPLVSYCKNTGPNVCDSIYFYFQWQWKNCIMSMCLYVLGWMKMRTSAGLIRPVFFFVLFNKYRTKNNSLAFVRVSYFVLFFGFRPELSL